MPTVPDWCLYKYRVDFEPEETRTYIRKGLLRLHKERVGVYIFDGTTLYTSCRLPDVSIIYQYIFHITVYIIKIYHLNVFINMFLINKYENFRKWNWYQLDNPTIHLLKLLYV